MLKLLEIKRGKRWRATIATKLTSQIKKNLPPELLKLVVRAGQLGASRGHMVYLVGGLVRDMLLGRPNLDIDLVVEGDAIELAHQIAQTQGGEVLAHSRFGTAKLRRGDLSIDLVTARSETYKRPGALPTVKPGTIEDDLFRRDFTINAMAVHLNPLKFGELVDPYGGKDDLEHSLIRILHERSFIDDATRILRALRYEQRLGFRLERGTEELLRRDVGMMETISGERLRREVEMILEEERPEKVLLRGEELGVLEGLHPSLKGNGWLAGKFERARQVTVPDASLYLCLLVYQLTNEENEGIIGRLKISGKTAKSMRDTHCLKGDLANLSDPDLPPSAIYQLLHGYSPQAILACSIASPSAIASSHLELYLKRLRYVKPLLTGEAIIKMGMPPGPRLGEIIRALHRAKLDGKVRTKEEEEAIVHQWLAEMI